MDPSPFIPKLPYRSDLKEKARELRKNPTPAEKLFWNTLRTLPFYPEFRFSRQKPLGNFIADFYCPKLKLVIELDGHNHSESGQQKHDEERTNFFEAYGLTVIRFSNKEVLNSIEGVMHQLEKTVSDLDTKIS